MVRGGGTLAVTTWGTDPLEPLAGVFWEAVGDVRPDLVRGFSPWDSLVTTEALLDLLGAAGIGAARAEAEEAEQPVDGPDGWWSIVLGSGFRGTVDALDEAQRAHVERAVRARLAGTRAMRAPAVYATAVKPP
jgi:hypothetical protein